MRSAVDGTFDKDEIFIKSIIHNKTSFIRKKTDKVVQDKIEQKFC